MNADREPTRAEVRARLEGLVAGTLSPADASDWARPWITEEAGDVQDEVVWDALGALWGADSAIGPGEYLYGPLDFQDWLADFDARSQAD